MAQTKYVIVPGGCLKHKENIFMPGQESELSAYLQTMKAEDRKALIAFGVKAGRLAERNAPKKAAKSEED